MQPNRRLILFLILFYAAFVVGVNLHYHKAKDQNGPDCNLCQLSHVSLVQTAEVHSAPEVAVLGSTDTLSSATVVEDTSRIPLGRAPPLS